MQETSEAFRGRERAIDPQVSKSESESASVGDVHGDPHGGVGGSPAPARGGLGVVLACWIGILAIAGLVIVGADEPVPSEEEATPSAIEPPIGLAEEMAGRITLALSRWLPAQDRSAVVSMSGLAGVPDDPRPRRLMAEAILLAEVGDSSAALSRLDDLDLAPSDELGEEEAAELSSIREVLRSAMGSPERPAPPISLETRDLLRRELGWFGEVTLRWELPPDDPVHAEVAAKQRTLLLVILATGAWYVGFGAVGFALLILVIVLTAVGRLVPKVAPNGAAGRLGSIYAETFLVWLVIFVGMQWLASLLLGGAGLLEGGCIMVGSLAALAWPHWRGLSFSRIRADLGLEWGRPRWMTPIGGVATYAIAMPLLVLGVLLSTLLTALLQPTAPPQHPVQQEIALAGTPELLGILLLAAVIVPPVEEIMFRGVLYRHLREATGRLGAVASFLVAALLSSGLFAAIHPQGIAFAPVLAALAVAFCIARELLGGLGPAIVAHGITNGVVVLLNAAILGTS